MKTTILLTTLFLFFSSCESRERDNKAFQWLLASLGTTSPAQDVQIDPGVPSSPSTETINVSMQVSDVQGNSDFLFNTLQTIPIQINIQDAFELEATPLVRIVGGSPSPGAVLFQAVPDTNGNVQGTFTYNRNEPKAVLEILYQGEVFRFDLELTYTQELVRMIRINGQSTQFVISDKDGDGVEDLLDAYPEDSTRSTKLVVPGSGFSTVAFEDLYPSQGDADFNDYVLRVINEEDLNASGKIVRLRGSYEHIARGAGYRHTLHLRLPANTVGEYTLKRYSYSGTLEFTETKSISGDIEILPNSGTTISQSNTDSGQTFQKGKKAEIEIIFSSPVSKSELGQAPYDLFLYVINTAKEIHFLGKYFENGKDRYLDPQGFPWAILVPGVWAHPYEKVDVRSSYPNFKSWYENLGSIQKDWYLFPDFNRVFPIN